MLFDCISKIRAVQPRVHCIANFVAANDMANILLAAGAKPIMAVEPDEMSDITPNCNALLINMGTPTKDRHEAMLKAGICANKANIPVVADLVGIGASDFRLNFAKKFLSQVRCACIKGNSSELKALLNQTLQNTGVDSTDETLPIDCLKQLAKQYHCVVLVTGKTDIITDGNAVFYSFNGNSLMGTVTGSGCMLGALVAAFMSVKNSADSVLGAVCAMGICGEFAALRMSKNDGNASFKNYMIDAWCHITDTDINQEAKYETQC